MRILLPSTKTSRGSGLIIVAILALVVASVLAFYLSMLENENTAVARSQSWNRAMVAAEAGVEEGLALINKYAYTSKPAGVTNWSTTAAVDGWDANDQPHRLAMTWTNYNDGSVGTWTNPGTIFHIQRTLDATNGFYDVYINYSPNPTNAPEILSIGQVNWSGAGNNFSVGNAVRSVHLLTANITQVTGGMIALNTMDFKGNNVTIDSFNSASNNFSIWQTNLTYHGTNYGIWSNSLSYGTSLPSRTANVYVATDYNVINVGNANIAGYVDTAPGGYPVVGSQGSVGDLTWALVNKTQGVQDGHQKSDMNVTFYSKPLPNPTQNGWQVGWLAAPRTAFITLGTTNIIKIGGTWTNISGIGWTNVGGFFSTNTGGGWKIGNATYDVVLTNRPANTNYVYYTYGLGTGQQLTISLFVDGQKQVLYLPHGLKYSGGDSLTLNTNSDVQIWTGDDFDTSGGGTINNFAQYSLALQLYDIAGISPGSQTLNFGGNGVGTGLIYAPSSALQFNGGGSGTYDVVGAIFCYNIQINGHYNFHFDEQLKTALPTDQYTPLLWQEVH